MEGAGAFRDCDALFSLTLGAGVTSLGDDAVTGCDALAAFFVASGNPAYAASGGVLFTASGTTLLRVPPALSGAYAVPATVTDIAPGAFDHCAALTAVTLPATLVVIPDGAFYYAANLSAITLPESLVSIGAWAFGGCAGLTTVTLPASLATLSDDAFHYATSLSSALFAGDAPVIGATVFDNTADDFALYFRTAATGFTATTWSGYASASFAVPVAVAQWLVSEGQAASADITSDPDGDGVPLLLAYAFGLDPAANLAGALPQPELVDGYLSLSFPAAAEGVTYTPQASTDLATWSTEGVSLVGPDNEGVLVALTPATTPRAFLRVAVTLDN